MSPPQVVQWKMPRHLHLSFWPTLIPGFEPVTRGQDANELTIRWGDSEDDRVAATSFMYFAHVLLLF